ncbi:thymidine phosphorylase [Candidatus Pacearchaeota archaeon]|nr:MAG: thymidine phosphorylase [Candidatus Pacearchaeota archaeon]
MKLKVKNLNWMAGRPVAFLHEDTAKRINVFANDRLEIVKPKKVYAIVDIFSKVVKKNEIGISLELGKILKLKTGSNVEIKTSEISNATFLIRKKLSGKKLSQSELEFLISEIVHNNLSEAEIAYFTAAEKLRGMSKEEIINLTRAMVKTGVKLKFKGKFVVDKHCIGGIAGNRTTPLVVSICASQGLIFPKTSSRAITSAAGTADVIETLAKVELSIDEIKKVVKKTSACLAWGGSLGLAPSDDKIIRVERLLNLDIEAQLLASIMSKKIAAGAKYLLIDIPYGRGAKVPNLKKAKSLGKKFFKIAREFGLNLHIVYTDGSLPIGHGFGPVLEMLDILKVLRNEIDAPQDLRDKSIFLASEIFKMCKIKNPRKLAENALISGEAYQKFKEIVNAQNGSNNFERRVANLRLGRIRRTIYSKKSGRIKRVGNHEINSICRILGTPETATAGLKLHKKTGVVKKSDPLMTLYTESRNKLDDAIKFIKKNNPIIIA